MSVTSLNSKSKLTQTLNMLFLTHSLCHFLCMYGQNCLFWIVREVFAALQNMHIFSVNYPLIPPEIQLIPDFLCQVLPAMLSSLLHPNSNFLKLNFSLSFCTVVMKLLIVISLHACIRSCRQLR